MGREEEKTQPYNYNKTFPAAVKLSGSSTY